MKGRRFLGMMNSYISGDLSMGPSDSADTDMEGQLDSDKIDEGEIDFGIHHQFDVNTFGNNMIVYVTMRCIAEKYGLNIEQKFPSFFKDPIKYTPKSNVKKIPVCDKGNLAKILSEYSADPDTTFYPDAHSFFQTKESAYAIQEFIKESLVDDMPKESEGIIIHYRLGDLVHNEQGSDDRVVKMEYFERAIESIPNYEQYKRYITSDSPNDDRIKHIVDKYGFEKYHAHPAATIKFASQFSHKILSLGTFSWWIGILGNQSNVFHPVVQEYPILHGDIFVFNHWNSLSFK